MPLGLAVFLAVLAATVVLALVGFLVDRSAESSDREHEAK